jgi:hypothetical protein
MATYDETDKNKSIKGVTASLRARRQVTLSHSRSNTLLNIVSFPLSSILSTSRLGVKG